MTVRHLAAPLLGLTLTAGAAGAATFTPTTTADGFDGACDAHCTLREAIAAANAAPGPDVVHLGPGVYELTRAGAGEDAGATGDLDAAGDLTLAGAGAAATVIDGRGLDRVLHGLGGGRLEVTDLTVRNGSAPAPQGLGGGILGGSELVIRRSIVAGSRADAGGGVFAGGELDLAASTFVDNAATTSGGGMQVEGVARLENSTFSGNRAPRGAGLVLPLFNATALNLTLVDNGPAENALFLPGDVTLPIDPLTRVVQSVISTTTGPATEDGFEVHEDSLLGERLGLGPLAWNGGPTPTHAPLPDSPVVDVGGFSCPTAADQRGRHRPQQLGDHFGFAHCDLGAVELGFSGCITGGTELCLGERFRVTARFVTPAGVQGEGRATAITPDTGNFWFFDPANVEIIVKVLDACGGFDRYWVFLAGLTNVEVEVTVEDAVTGRLETYTNPQGRPFQPILDTEAFATCP